MKVAITGHRQLLPEDLKTVLERMVRIVRDPDVLEVFFGGAIGADTDALRFALQHRIGPGQPFLTVVVPDTIQDQSVSARIFAERADRILELHHPITPRDNYAAYQRRNHYLVDQIRGQGELIAFWNGSWRSGTGQTVRYAQSVDAAWEHVEVFSEPLESL